MKWLYKGRILFECPLEIEQLVAYSNESYT